MIGSKRNPEESGVNKKSLMSPRSTQTNEEATAHQMATRPAYITSPMSDIETRGKP